MSTNGIFSYNSSYNSTTSLLSSLYGTSSKSSISTQSLLSSIYSSSNYGSYYGVNTSKTSSSLSSYLVGIKKASSGLRSAIKTAQDKSIWNKISYNSSSNAVGVDYTGKDKLKDMTVEVKSLAKSQINEGKKLNSNASTVRSTSFSIKTADGTKKNFYVSTGSSLSNLDVQQKVADKINSAKMGITASIEKDSKGNSRLVLKGESGKDNDFTVSGALAEDLGITNVSQEAQDAVYSINSGEDQTSSTNKIKIDDELTLNLKEVTDEPAKLTYSKNQTSGINAARSFVNGFNELYDTARDYDDLGSLQLQSKLVGLVAAYSSSLERIGISTDENGYLKIDEDKMKKAADNGDLEKFFTNDAGANYGFVNRVDRIASQVESDPTKFVSASAKEEMVSSDSSYYSSYASEYSKLMGSSSFRKSYFNYITTSALFDALF